MERRRAAAKEIREACYAKRVPSDLLPLLEAMALDADEVIADCAISGLCRCGAAAVPVVERMAVNTSARVRGKGCYIAGHLEGDTRALHPAVFAALDDAEPGVRAQAAFALGRMADRSAATIDALATAARDPEPQVRLWAIDALGRFGGEDGAAAALSAHGAVITTAMGDPDLDVRKSATSALEEMSTVPDGQVVAAVLDRLRVEQNDDVLQCFRQLISRRDLLDSFAQHVPTLLAAADANPRARAIIFVLCGALGPRASASVPALESSVERSNAPYEAIAALWTLTGNAGKCITALEKLLERSWYDASRALELLSKITDGSRYVIPMLRHAIPDSPDEAAAKICELGPAAAALLPDLARAIESNWDEPDWDLMWALADALCAIESSEPLAVATLSRLLTHPSSRVRYIAVTSLGRAGPAARAALGVLGHTCEDEDAQVAKAARAAIREIGLQTN